MESEPSLRLPLQTGDTAVRSFALGAVCLAAAAPFVALFVARITHDQDPTLTAMETMYALPLLAGFAYTVLVSRRSMPSDLVLTREGCTVIGGASRGATVTWADVASCAFRRYQPFAWGDVRIDDDVPVGHDESATLELVLRSGRTITLALTTNEIERASLDALRLTIEALLAPAEAAGDDDGAPLRARTIACVGCGAALHPTSAATTACKFCGGENRVPKDVMELVATNERVSDAEAQIDRYVARVRSGTQLARVRKTVLAIWVAAAAFLVALAIEVALFVHGYARAGALGWLVVVGLAFVPAVAMLGYDACIDRRAARFFSLGLAATPATRAGEPPSCRRCGASLPDTTRPIARCLYCRVDNVLGVDLAVRLARDTEQKASVEETTHAAQMARTKWSGGGRILGGSLLAMVLVLLVVIYRGRPVAPIGGAGEVMRVTWDPYETARLPALSPNGKTIAYTRMNQIGKGAPPTPQLAVVPAAGGFGETRMPDVGNVGVFEMSDWAPDGRTVYGTNAGTIAVADPQRNDNSPHASRDELDATPRVRPGHADVLVVVRAGNVTVGETSYGVGTHPAWFADGESLAFTRQQRIWTVRVGDPTSARALSTSPCPADYAAPDAEGHRIAYVASCKGKSAIVIQWLTKDTTTTITRGSATLTDLRWQRDHLYFTADGAIFRLRPP